MQKVLFFDIDGTLVSFKTHQIPQSAIDALTKVHQEGHKIIIATGRHKSIINNLGPLQELGLIDGYVTLNGAYCFVGDKVLYSSPMSNESARIVAQVCEKENIPCVFVGKDYRVAGANQLYLDVFERQCNVPKSLVPDVDYCSPLQEDIYQLSPFLEAERMSLLAPQLKDCEIERWHPAFADITAKGNTKAHGMDVIMDYYGIPKENSIAFGDGGNDVSLLEHAGIGVALGNGTDEARNAADYVTASVEDDGVAKALKHIGLIS